MDSPLDAGVDRLTLVTGRAPRRDTRGQALLAWVPTPAGQETSPPAALPTLDQDAAAVRFVAMPRRLQQLIGDQPPWVVGRRPAAVLPGLDEDRIRAVARTGRPETTAQAVLIRPDTATNPPTTTDPTGTTDPTTSELTGTDLIGSDAGTFVLVLPLPLLADDTRGETVVAEPLFELAFSGAPVGMAVTCGGDVLVRANHALSDLLGRTPSELLGVSLDHIGAAEEALAEEPGLTRAAAAAPAGAAPGAGGPTDRRVPVATARARPFVHRAGRVVWLRVSTAEVGCGPIRVTVSHFVDVTAERRVARQMAHAATHDELTGLPNRAWLFSALQRALNEVPMSALALGRRAPAVLFVDLDDFKDVNDSLGHDAGDRLLRQIAQRLRRAVRPEDAVARFGGDELVVLCQDLPDGAAADQLCQRLLATVADPVEVDGRPITVGASIGVAHADLTSTPQSLLRDADSAMYAAKRAGRNRYVVSDALLRGFALAALTEESELRSALEARRLEVQVTPIRRLSTMRISAVNTALLWRHPARGLLEPAYCVGLAARTDMSRAMGSFLLEESCRLLPGWREQSGEQQLRAAVALTAEHLEHPEVVDDVRHALRRHSADPGSLIIEVPERALVNDSTSVAAHLLQLDAEGVRLTLTEFGSGYSALGLLRTLPISGLDLDRMFLAGAADGGREAVLLRAIADLGAALGLTVRASGADTVDLVRSAQSAGCTHAAGRALGEISEQATWPQPPAEEPDSTNVVPLGRRSSRRA